jgi:CP family cyanate transporter-like MFS transporter
MRSLQPDVVDQPGWSLGRDEPRVSERPSHRGRGALATRSGHTGLRRPGRPVPTRLTLIGVLLLALNLRAAIAGLPPLVPDLRADLRLDRGTAGLLTTLPVLCFALLSPLGAALGRRIGTDRALLLGVLAVAAGSLARTAPGLGWMLCGTAVVGAGITVGNVLVPSVVKRDFPGSEGAVTGLYTAALIAGAALSSALAAPLAHEAGLGWRASLLIWGGLAAVAAIVWLPRLRAAGSGPAARRRPPRTGVWRSPVTWQLALFMGMQALAYYTMLAWLPALLQDNGVSGAAAGWALALFNLLGIASSLVLPSLAGRRPDQRALGLLSCLGWAGSLIGLLVAAPLYLVWVALAGLAQGASISLALAMIVLRASTPAVARDLSGTVQSAGYLLASGGPVLVGWLRDRSDGWQLPLAFLGATVAIMAVAALGAGRDRQV